MKMRRATLAAVASQRGYSGNSVAACITTDYGDGWVEIDTEHPAYPRARPGLGDMVKGALSSIGITEERVSKAIGRPCGCSERAKKLNELGRKIGIG